MKLLSKWEQEDVIFPAAECFWTSPSVVLGQTVFPLHVYRMGTISVPDAGLTGPIDWLIETVSESAEEQPLSTYTHKLIWRQRPIITIDGENLSARWRFCFIPKDATQVKDPKDSRP